MHHYMLNTSLLKANLFFCSIFCGHCKFLTEHLDGSFVQRKTKIDQATNHLGFIFVFKKSNYWIFETMSTTFLPV